MTPEQSTLPEKRRKRSRLTILIAVCVVIVLLAAGVIIILRPRTGSTVQIPSAISQRLTFSAYIPSELPGNFRLVQGSFSYDEGVLVFQAEDDTGLSIAFSEQPKPQGFDFANFYSQQLTGAKNLDNVPFASVTGKMQQSQSTVLSVLAHKTWVLVSSRSVLSQDDLELIARSMKIQNK